MPAMHQLLLTSLCVLALAASNLALASEDSQKRLSTWFPTYTNRSQVPEMWDGITQALKEAGVPNHIVTIRVRQTAMWSAHVELKPRKGETAQRAVVGYPLNGWKVLCVTSDVEDCSRYNP
jgi:hypothetical protein